MFSGGKCPITFSQIADGGDLETQMFGLTTKINKMQEATINNETPAIGNVLLAEVNYSAVETVLEPWIGWVFPVVKRTKNKVWVERDYGVKKVVKYDSSLFNFR